ncbi:MAG TPA: sulfatase-like hydrolase/transferase, partial [Chitinophagaceae bacterium]
MKKILLFFLLLISLFSFAQNKKPNVLIIITDDQGYHDVSYYGTPDLQTPNIDQLCKQGMRFDNFYANSCVCSPSRASLMSGRYPEMVGVPGLIRNKPEDNFGFLTPGVQLLPDLLKKANYKTAIVGKWNLGLESPNLPNEKGFDYFHGWLDDMMEDYWKHLRNGKNFLRENGKEIQAEGHATDLFTQWTIDYLHQQKNSRQPFFLYLAYTAPHAPIQPAPEFLAKVKERLPQLSEKRAK